MPPPAHSHLSQSLRESLFSVLEGRSSPHQVNELVHLSVAIATEFLSRKRGARRLQERLGLTAGDLAYDCVADLFERDDRGRYIQLDAYFRSVEYRTCEAEELLILLRRLVYSRTGNGLFRLYGEIDPAFSRVLRNVKLALQALKQFEERDRFGEVHVSPLFCPTLEHLPPFEPQEFECVLSAECTGAESVPELMGKIALLLRRQEERSRLVPLMLVASTIRAVYELRNRPQLAAHVEPARCDDEGPVLVSAACAKVKADMRRSYTGRKHVAEETYEWYFAVIAESLLEKLAGRNGDAASYYHYLRSYVPQLTVDEYKRKHRSRLEYLGSLVQKRLRGMVTD